MVIAGPIVNFSGKMSSNTFTSQENLTFYKDLIWYNSCCPSVRISVSLLPAFLEIDSLVFLIFGTKMQNGNAQNGNRIFTAFLDIIVIFVFFFFA